MPPPPWSLFSPAFGSNTYSVTGSFTNGCADSRTISVQAYNCTGIDELFSSAGLKVYPNPSNGYFVIETDLAFAVQVFNEAGAIVLEKKLVPGKNNIDLKKYANGVYFLKYKTESGINTIKMVKTD